MHKIPFFGLAKQYRNLKDELLEATDEALKYGIVMNGEFTQKFEKWLSEKTNYEFAVTVHSGTQALEIIARYYLTHYTSARTIKIPNLTYVATLNAFLNAGWDVELVDTDKNGLAVIDTEEKIDNFVCLVGLYGANPHKTNILTATIADGAQHWLVADEEYDAMAISFDPTKNLPASGNGGAIVTNDPQLYEFALSFRSNGKTNSFDTVEHHNFGTNSRMSEQECAQILVRTNYIDKWQWRRKEIRHFYLDEFKNLPFSCLSREFPIHADQKFVLYTDKRNVLRQHLEEKGIETRIQYPKALSELPLAKNLVKPDMLSTSVMLTRGLLSLPIYPELSDSEVEFIAKEVKKFFTC